MRDEFTLWKNIDVRWGDMDAMGHVNNTRFFTFFESARILYFDEVQLKEAGGPTNGPALAHVECDFKQQVHYPATLDVGVRVGAIGNSSIKFEHVILRQGTGEVVAKGMGIIVWIDYSSGTSEAIPDDLRARIEAYEGRSFPV